MGTEGIITLGIGSAPGGLLWFFTLGLGTPTESVLGLIGLTARGRGFDLTGRARDFGLTSPAVELEL